jgi:predicted ATP-grasp superfamily ATP-dependent carboligase
LKANHKFSVLIPDGESAFALQVLQCLSQKKGVKIFVLADKSWPKVRFSRYVAKFIPFNGAQGEEGRLELIIKVVKHNLIDVVLPVDEKTIRYISENRKSIDGFTSLVPLPDIPSFDLAINKWTLSQWAIKTSIPCPETILYASEPFKNNGQATKLPVLIKPLYGGGGKGISFFKSQKELDLHLCNEMSGKFIIQKFVEGFDIDCSVLCINGDVLAYTIQKVRNQRDEQFVPMMQIDFVNNTEVYDLVKKVVKELVWSGVVHFDLRYDIENDEIKLIEMNCRYWASVLGSLIAGVNFPYLSCLTALNINYSMPNFEEYRFVNGGMALRIQLGKLLRLKKGDDNYDRSSLKIMLRDPGPYIANEIMGWFNAKITNDAIFNQFSCGRKASPR